MFMSEDEERPEWDWLKKKRHIDQTASPEAMS